MKAREARKQKRRPTTGDIAMRGLVTFARIARDRLRVVGRAWSQFWFQPSPTTPLELARIGLGAALLCHYALATPYLFLFWGYSGWMPREIAVEYLVNPWIHS